MGQTVSLPTCISGGSTVRVMRPDGEFEVFDFPCIAAEVMVQHANHLVVHCSPVDRNSLGQRSKVTIVPPDKPLLPGQPYMLYPIPDKFRKTLARSKSFSMVKKRFEPQVESAHEAEAAEPPTVTPGEKRRGRRKALKMLFTRLHLATFVAHNLQEGNDESPGPALQPPRPGFQIESESESEPAEGKDKDPPPALQVPERSFDDYAWRPLLSPVPESPLGFHAAPLSPLGLYKTDAAVPLSPLAIGARPLPTFVAAA